MVASAWRQNHALRLCSWRIARGMENLTPVSPPSCYDKAVFKKEIDCALRSSVRLLAVSARRARADVALLDLPTARIPCWSGAAGNRTSFSSSHVLVNPLVTIHLAAKCINHRGTEAH